MPDHHASPTTMPDAAWPAGASECTTLVRAYDWSTTCLGPISGWSQAFRSAVDIVLRAPVAMALLCGSEHLLIYNEAYAAICGEKHPGALGMSVRDVWPEAWWFNGEVMRACLAGEVRSYHDEHFVLNRHGAPQESWFDLYYAPVAEASGSNAHVIATVIETTARMHEERARRDAEVALRQINTKLDLRRRHLEQSNRKLHGDMEFLRGLFEQAPSFMAVLLGPTHVFELANASYLRLIGNRDILGKPVRQALPELEGQGFCELLDGVYASGAPYYGRKVEAMLESGAQGGLDRVILDFVYQPLKDAEGRTCGIFVEGIDVTAHWLAEERLRAAQEAGQIGSFEWHAASNEVSVSDSYRRIWGFNEQDEVSMEMLLARIDPAHRHLALPARVGMPQEPFAYDEFRITRADTGEHRWLARRFRDVGRQAGKASRCLGVVFDITERKLIEENLRQVERQLRDNLDFIRLLLDAGEEAFIATDDKGRATLCNRAFLTMFGFADEAEVHGRNVQELIPRHASSARTGEPCGITEAIVGGEVVVVRDEVVMRRDGGALAVNYRASPIRRDARLEGVLCTIVDVSQKKRQLAALNASEKRLATVFAQARIGLSEADAEGRFIQVNDFLCQMLGRSRAELIGMCFADLIHPEDREASLAGFRDMRQRGGPSSIEKRYLRADGSHVWGYTSVSSILDDAGRPLSYLAVTSDTTDRRRVEEMLRELNESLELDVRREVGERLKTEEALRQSRKMEAVGQLASGVAHDFNNVLQIISSNLQLMELDPAISALLMSRVTNAISAVERGSKLSSQLLAFARRQPLQPVVTNLGGLLRNMEHLLQRALGDPVAIEWEIEPELWNVLVDPNQLENAVLNMAINARDAMEGSGRLQLALANIDAASERQSGVALAAGHYVRLSLRDSGCGMPAEIVDKVFDPFFTTKEPGRGTGLGLSMVYGFVKQSGGEIRIDSAPGQGTCIAIYLPRAFHAEASTAPPVPTRVQGGDETILVVEDDAAVRAATVDMLTSLGYRALKAENAQQALAILQSGIGVDLLFSDIFLPGPFGGAELGVRAKAHAPGIALLYTSGQSLPPSGPDALPQGAVLLGKPYAREQLAASVRRQLAQRGAPASAIGSNVLQALALEPLRILVVDDSADAQELACEMLMALGHTAHGVASGEAALALLAGACFDVLFCDAHLPGMSAQELAAQATRIAPGMRILLASGEGEIAAGGRDFAALLIPKPYDLLQLQAALDDAALAPSRVA